MKIGPKETQLRAAREQAAVTRRKKSEKPAPRAKGGNLIAPPGECEYCDRRRAAGRDSVRRLRKKQQE